MTISPVTTGLTPYPRFGATPQRSATLSPPGISLPAFGAAATSNENEALSRKATAEERSTLAQLFETKVPADLAFTINTVGRPELLTVAGGMQTSLSILNAAAPTLGDPATGTVYVLVDYPDEAAVRLARKNVETLNKLIKPKSWKDRATATIGWGLLGVKCPMSPVEFVVNPSNRLQGALRIPIQGVSKSTLDKVSGILEVMPPPVVNFFQKIAG